MKLVAGRLLQEPSLVGNTGGIELVGIGGGIELVGIGWAYN